MNVYKNVYNFSMSIHEYKSHTLKSLLSNNLGALTSVKMEGLVDACP